MLRDFLHRLCDRLFCAYWEDPAPTSPFSPGQVYRKPCRPWWLSGNMRLASGLACWRPSQGRRASAGTEHCSLQSADTKPLKLGSARVSSGLQQWQDGETGRGSCSKGGVCYFSNSFTEVKATNTMRHPLMVYTVNMLPYLQSCITIITFILITFSSFQNAIPNSYWSFSSSSSFHVLGNHSFLVSKNILCYLCARLFCPSIGVSSIMYIIYFHWHRALMDKSQFLYLFVLWRGFRLFLLREYFWIILLWMFSFV